MNWEDSPGEETATHSSILAWEIPLTEEPGVLQPIGSQRVEHDLVTKHLHHIPSPLSSLSAETEGTNYSLIFRCYYTSVFNPRFQVPVTHVVLILSPAGNK